MLRKMLLVFLSLLLFACNRVSTSQTIEEATPASSKDKIVQINENFQAAMSGMLYVPAYSHIYFEDQDRPFLLAVNLSIRNPDISKPIILKSVKYYNDQGILVQSYVEQPIEIAPLAAKEFVVSRSNREGGLGASFIVEWVAATKVSQPLAEAVMIGTVSSQGLSWVTRGVVIEQH